MNPSVESTSKKARERNSGNSKSLIANSIILLAFLAAGAILSIKRGQDVNYDLLNYHYYNPWALLHARQGVDYFVSLTQSYFSPTLDFPYYFLASGSLKNYPKVISAIMGLPYGVILFIACSLSKILADEAVSDRVERNFIIVLCAAFSVGGSALWSQVGTTTNELPLAALILAGLLVFVKGYATNGDASLSRSRYIAIGMCFGCAVGLKLTASIYVPAMAFCILFAAKNNRERLQGFFWFCLAVALSIIVLYGPWAFHLYRETGNPFFPMLNNVFHSPWWETNRGRDITFLPKSALQWLLYPFYWATSLVTTVAEPPFRDPRFAMFYVIATLLLVASAWKRWRCPDVAGRSRHSLFALSTGFVIVAYIAWLAMFSILRYAVPIEVLASILFPLSAVLLFKKIAGPGKNKIAIAGSLVIVACAMAITTPPNWGRVQYSRQIFSVNAPTLPINSVVVMADDPLGFIAPFLYARQPTLRFVGAPSYMIKAKKYRITKTIEGIILSSRTPVYVAFYMKTPPVFGWLSEIGLQVDFQNCQTISTNVSTDIQLCQAHVLDFPLTAPKNFRLAADVIEKAGVKLNVKWPTGRCAPLGETDKTASLDWNVVTPSVERTQLVVQSPPSASWDTVTSGASSGVAVTGKWIQAGLVFELRAEDGSDLATARIKYLPCASE
jgi:hypothetical protein